jgi:hypothetical protein
VSVILTVLLTFPLAFEMLAVVPFAFTFEIVYVMSFGSDFNVIFWFEFTLNVPLPFVILKLPEL